MRVDIMLSAGAKRNKKAASAVRGWRPDHPVSSENSGTLFPDPEDSYYFLYHTMSSDDQRKPRHSQVANAYWEALMGQSSPCLQCEFKRL